MSADNPLARPYYGASPSRSAYGVPYMPSARPLSTAGAASLVARPLLTPSAGATIAAGYLSPAPISSSATQLTYLQPSMPSFGPSGATSPLRLRPLGGISSPMPSLPMTTTLVTGAITPMHMVRASPIPGAAQVRISESEAVSDPNATYFAPNLNNLPFVG
jgi:hypothetical protein